MLPFRVKGGSNLNSGIALSCCWYGPDSLRKKLIACRRTYSDHIVSRQRSPDPLQLELTTGSTLTASSTAISTRGLIRIWRLFAIQELLSDRIPLPCLSQEAGARSVARQEEPFPLYDKSLSICFWRAVVRNRWRQGEHL